MATNTPSNGTSLRPPVPVSRSARPRTERSLPSVPSTSSTTVFHSTRTFPFAAKRSWRMRSARKRSRRWITVTSAARLDR